MDELLATTPTLADRLVQYSDASFEIAFGPSGTMSPNRDLIYSARWGVSVIAPISFIAGDPESGGLFLSLAEAFIRQVREDLDKLPASVRSSYPAELCRRIAEVVGTALAYVPQARCAAFGDEEDGVTLVAHSRASKRQVSFEFGARGDTITIISIDEEMCRTERECRTSHVLTLGNAIAWLNPC